MAHNNSKYFNTGTDRLTHPFGPLFDSESRVLILGSFPSVKSREQNFFYGHPQNRFWKVIASVMDRPVPKDIPEKRILILENHLALWDSIESCEIVGSSDSSIRNARANDLRVILENSRVEQIFCNGRKSFELYNKYIQSTVGRDAICLPSTSPANAQWSLERLIGEWSVIKEYL
ncbi:MAG: DNA-deoxyinosine glycosylase [Firmicutes bacterium]|nr:DNA-deoxyinosine glycosylase [Bacillota bacterium]